MNFEALVDWWFDLELPRTVMLLLVFAACGDHGWDDHNGDDDDE